MSCFPFADITEIFSCIACCFFNFPSSPNMQELDILVYLIWVLDIWCMVLVPHHVHIYCIAKWSIAKKPLICPLLIQKQQSNVNNTKL